MWKYLETGEVPSGAEVVNTKTIVRTKKRVLVSQASCDRGLTMCAGGSVAAAMSAMLTAACSDKCVWCLRDEGLAKDFKICY
jgi:hypothetical protein